jgi:hypothetical protein
VVGSQFFFTLIQGLRILLYLFPTCTVAFAPLFNEKEKKYSLISLTTPRSISPYSRRKVQTHNPQISQSDSDLLGFPSSNGT